MSKVDTGGAAFPLPLKKEFFDAEGEHSGREELVDGDEGMTLLDHFAGLAMAAAIKHRGIPKAGMAGDHERDEIGRRAYQMAEEMVARKRWREKEK